MYTESNSSITILERSYACVCSPIYVCGECLECKPVASLPVLLQTYLASVRANVCHSSSNDVCFFFSRADVYLYQSRMYLPFSRYKISGEGRTVYCEHKTSCGDDCGSGFCPKSEFFFLSLNNGIIVHFSTFFQCELA